MCIPSRVHVGSFGPMNEANLSSIRLRSVVLDCPDPPALATFYGELLGGRVALDPIGRRYSSSMCR